MTAAETLLVGIVSGIVVAFATSWLTINHSLRRFYSEKWWERKAEAYSSIVEALYDVKNNLDALIRVEEVGREMPEETRKGLFAKSAEGYERINRQAGVGAFIISEDASKELASLKSDLDEISSADMGFYDWADRRASRVRDSLDKLRLLAKADLRVK